jgi:hypothetical protein
VKNGAFADDCWSQPDPNVVVVQEEEGLYVEPHPNRQNFEK